MSAVVFSVPRSLILVLVLPLISLEHAVINAQNSFLNFNCSITNGLYPGIQSPFFTNLNHLLFDLLYEEGNHSRFSIQKAGEDPDSVYGSYLCRGDLSPQWCQFCIRKAGEDVLNRCLNYKGAIIWYDGCTIRYSTSPITRDLVIDPVSCMHDWRFLSKDDVTFSAIVNSTLRNLRLESIFPFTNMYYASDELHISESANLYGMVQCVPNMVRSDCLHCLDFAIDMVLRCSNGRMGGSVLTPSCVVTYGDYSFYWEAFGAARQAHGSSSKKRRKWGRIAICGSISAFLIVLLRYLGSYYWRITQKEDGKEDYSTTVESLELAGRKFIIDFSRDECLAENLSKCQELPTISLDQVRAATGHFSEESKLGKGGFGVVYKGTLLDGKEIAVKRLSRTSTQGIEEFKNEVSLIARLQHRNLVKLLGCCLEDNESLLIYEYMPNKSLDFFLFDATKGGELDWKRRLIIIKGIARGILYLHEDSRLRIVHRDLKTSNILLDHEMNPKISDFGLARIFEANQSIANTRRVVGTYGYMAPEYAMEGVYSVKSDVFSFGVLLLEIISGKKNSGFYLHEHDHNLLTFAWELWSEGRGLELLDSALEQSFVGDEVMKCIHIGLLCAQYNPADRPTMSSVVLMLASDSMTLCQPMKPAFAVGCLLLGSLECATDAEGVTANGMTISDVTPR